MASPCFVSINSASGDYNACGSSSESAQSAIENACVKSAVTAHLKPMTDPNNMNNVA